MIYAVLTICTTQQIVRVHHFLFNLLVIYRKQYIDYKASPQQYITDQIVFQ